MENISVYKNIILENLDNTKQPHVDFTDERVIKVQIKDIVGISPNNCRKELFDTEDDEDTSKIEDSSQDRFDILVENMKKIGYNEEPITLDSKMEIAAGGRRYKAAQKAGLTWLYCIKIDFSSDLDEKLYSIRENTAREPLTKKDLYSAIDFLTNEAKMSVRDIECELGIPKSTVNRIINREDLKRLDVQARKDEELRQQKRLETRQKNKELLKKFQESLPSDVREKIETRGDNTVPNGTPDEDYWIKIPPELIAKLSIIRAASHRELDLNDLAIIALNKWCDTNGSITP